MIINNPNVIESVLLKIKEYIEGILESIEDIW